MPQMLLPIFPSGETESNDELAFRNEDGLVTYFNRTMLVFQHAADDENLYSLHFGYMLPDTLNPGYCFINT